MMRVPFVDLRPYNTPLLTALCGADLHDLIDANDFTGGRWVNRFEEEWATFCRQGHCVGVASGLDALRLTLLALGVGPGDEVIVPALTFIATWEAVSQTGATPVPVDVLPDGLIDPAAVALRLGERTRAVIPVHLCGRMADMVELARIVVPHARAVLVEDAAQAHGARRDAVPVGELSTAAAFSFYPTKPLGAWGDAGAVVTSYGWLDTALRRQREHGQTRKYEHATVGWTSRLDNIQALVLSHKLAHLPQMMEERTRLARGYNAALDGVGDLQLPADRPMDETHAWHLYTVYTEQPDALAVHLAERGVGTGRHYPVATHLQPAYRMLGYWPGAFPRAEAIAAQTLSLPLWPGMLQRDQNAVVRAVRSYFKGKRGTT